MSEKGGIIKKGKLNLGGNLEFSELQKIAQDTLNERRLSRLATAGTVAAAFLTDKGNVYTGVCIDVPAGMGFCAEHAAAAAMVTAGESKIVKMVATGVDDNGCGCAPCGRCREFINCLHEDNYLCEVLLEDGSITTIGELLPYRL